MFAKKHYVKISVTKEKDGLFVVGLVKKKVNEKLIINYKTIETEIKVVSKETEFDFDVKIKQVKKCNHKKHEIGTLEFDINYERLEYFHYCEGCGKVLETYILPTTNTNVLHEIRYEENSIKGIDERLESMRKSIEYYESKRLEHLSTIEELKKQLK